MEVFVIVLHIVYLLIAAAAAAAISIHTMTRWQQFWLPVAVFAAAVLALWALHVLIISVISLFVDTNKKPTTVRSFFRWVAIVTLDVFMAAAGARYHVEGREKLPDRPFLLVCNHLSITDPLALMVVFRDRCLAFISKKENRAIPVISRFMVPAGCLFLDRTDSRSAIYTIREAAEYIRNGICSMAICPEGTRNRTDAPVLPFHAGSFKIAAKAECPLVIAGISGTEKIHRHFPFRLTRVDIRVLDVLSEETVAETRSADLARTAEDEIAAWLTEIRK